MDQRTGIVKQCNQPAFDWITLGILFAGGNGGFLQAIIKSTGNIFTLGEVNRSCSCLQINGAAIATDDTVERPAGRDQFGYIINSKDGDGEYDGIVKGAVIHQRKASVSEVAGEFERSCAFWTCFFYDCDRAGVYHCFCR